MRPSRERPGREQIGAGRDILRQRVHSGEVGCGRLVVFVETADKIGPAELPQIFDKQILLVALPVVIENRLDFAAQLRVGEERIVGSLRRGFAFVRRSQHRRERFVQRGAARVCVWRTGRW